METKNQQIIKSSYNFLQNPAEQDYASHIHNTYEILYFLQGNVQMVIGGNVYIMKRGDLFITRPAVFHSVKVIDTKMPYERFVFNFSESFIPAMSKDFFSQARDVYNIPHAHPIALLMEEWKKICQNNDVENIKEVEDYILKAILSLLSEFKTAKEIKPIKSNKLLDEILKYIDERPTEKITVQQLSDVFFMSKSWIVHTFRNQLDISIMDYVNKKRMIYAQTLIANGLTPTQACEQCNFSDYSTFYRQYKKFLASMPKNDKKTALE